METLQYQTPILGTAELSEKLQKKKRKKNKNWNVKKKKNQEKTAETVSVKIYLFIKRTHPRFLIMALQL